MKDLVLYHHGIKGMKWGVRKQRPESIGRRTGSKKKTKMDPKRKKELIKTGAKVTALVLGGVGSAAFLAKQGRYEELGMAATMSLLFSVANAKNIQEARSKKK